MKRNATAVWEGSLKEGKGKISTQSKTLDNTQYSFNTRFADGIGSNPEELIAAAHAECFTMKLSFVINEAGATADNIDTKCTITLDNGAITSSHLEVTATVPGMDAEKFKEAAENAKANCPISKLLNTEITMDASLK